MSGECDNCGEHTLECHCKIYGPSAILAAKIQWYFDYLNQYKKSIEDDLIKYKDDSDNIFLERLQAVKKTLQNDLIEEYFLLFDVLLVNR